jgi:uncharacterized protein
MAQADCALGNQYLLGLGVEKNPAKAFTLCKHSAELGAREAQTDLGQMYLAGQVVPRDPQEAAPWALTTRWSDFRLQAVVDDQSPTA